MHQLKVGEMLFRILKILLHTTGAYDLKYVCFWGMILKSITINLILSPVYSNSTNSVPITLSTQMSSADENISQKFQTFKNKIKLKLKFSLSYLDSE